MPERPIFVEVNAQQIVDEIVASYEALTGEVLPPAAPERLILNTFAYREVLVRNAIQYTGEQNLVAFSNAPALDFLGELVGVIRLAPASASTTLKFTVSDGHSGVVIPEGTRVQSTDQQVVFVTTKALEIEIGETEGEVEAEAETAGLAGNGYLAGSISVILDPVAFVLTAENLGVTAGGSDEESDEQLRERIILAPNAFSSAGSRQSYEFFAKSAHPSIVDVSVTSPNPGEVAIYPLIAGGGVTPPEILNAVEEACSDEKVRPITDTVIVISPTSISYSIVANLTLLNTADLELARSTVLANLQTFTELRSKKLGLDVLKTQLYAQVLNVEGLYNVNFPSFNDIVVNNSSVAKCTSIIVNVTGLVDG